MADSDQPQTDINPADTADTAVNSDPASSSNQQDTDAPATPLAEEEDKSLTSTHSRATNNTDVQNTAQSTQAEQQRRNNQESTDTILATHFQMTNEQAANGDFGDLAANFFEILMAVFAALGGDSYELERWASIQDYLSEGDNYVDPSQRNLSGVTNIGYDPEANENSATNRLRRELGHTGFQQVSGALGTLMGHISNLESDGNACVVTDYRHKTIGGSGYTGFNPGDTTPGGLRVPDCTQMTIGRVMDWQQQYLDEQLITNGQNVGYTATGQYQFTLTRLKTLTEAGLLSKNLKFDEVGQQIATLANIADRMKTHLGNDYQNLSAVQKTERLDNFIDGMKAEWVSLHKVDDQELRNLLGTIAEEGPSQIAAATAATTPTRT